MSAESVRIPLKVVSTVNEAPVPSVRPVLADIKREGFQEVVVHNGEIFLAVKFPGLAVQELSLEDLETFAERLSARDGESDTPAGVFLRTATVDSDGNLSGQFSYGARSRTLTVPNNERYSLADLIAGKIEEARTAVELHRQEKEKEEEAKRRAEAAVLAASTPKTPVPPQDRRGRK